jgi:hypothetical protein
MAYSLQRILCSEEETHIILYSGGQQQIDVVAGTMMYFKVNVANRFPPAALHIKYLNG